MSLINSQKTSDLHSVHHQQYSTVVFLIILILAVSLVIFSDYRRFEKKFATDVERIHTRFDFYIKQNEAVLEGLSAFVAGVGDVNAVMLNRYAAKVKKRFPHIYMLEVAQEVKRENLALFIKKQQKDGYKDFDIRAFDYSKNRTWRKLPKAESYFPLVYLYPLPKEAHKVLGLDLTSHNHLALPLKKSLEQGDYQTSVPFTLIEGQKAYAMFKAVDLGANDSADCFIALIIVTADAFNFDIDRNNNSLGLMIYHNSKNKKDTSGYFILKDIKVNHLLPEFIFETRLKSEKSGFILQVTKQFQLKDINWILLFIILFGLISVFYVLRCLQIKNISIQDKLFKTSQQKHKMIALSNLTGGLAHEFNNNLSITRGFLSLLSDRLENDSESKSWIEHIATSTEKSIGLTRKLLTYSRYKGIRERVSSILINEKIINMKNELSQLLNKNVSLKYKLDEELCSVLFYEDDLKEILFELVINANDAIEDNGLITISTRKVHLDSSKVIEIGHDTDIITGDYVHLAVSDTGSGISEDIKLHVFDPFFTTKSFGASSGMGLASVYGLVKLNNGYITFSSNGERGIVFDIFIPVLE